MNEAVFNFAVPDEPISRDKGEKMSKGESLKNFLKNGVKRVRQIL